MKNLAEHFLSAEERQQVEAAVAAAEKRTAGEIVCLVLSASYHYPLAGVVGAAAVALPLALLATHYLGGSLWLGTQNMWLFLGFFAVLFALLHWIMGRWPLLKRPFIARREIDAEVEEAAINEFFRRGLYRTRDANGVLLLLSVYERKVWLLADKGIHEKVGQAQWNELVGRITREIRKGRRAEAICHAVETIADLLETHYPIKPDDTNELQNLIVGDA